MLARLSDVRLQHLEDEEVVLVDQCIVGETAFEIGVSLDDQRRHDAIGLLRGEPEVVKLVDLRAGRVSDPENRVGERRGRQVDHGFPVLAEWKREEFIKTKRTGIDPGGHELDGKLMRWRDIGKRANRSL